MRQKLQIVCRTKEKVLSSIQFSRFQGNGAPARHNPLRMAVVFQGAKIEKDENLSTCIGHDFTTEICIQVTDCVEVEDEVDK